MEIIEFIPKYQDQLLSLILNIQRNEFGINISVEDQPDLADVYGYYISGGGNFWLAVEQGELHGSIALINLGQGNYALRKMFVKAESRGPTMSVATQLHSTAELWLNSRSAQTIYLGTTKQFKAAQRFYKKLAYDEIGKQELPQNFPIMAVDSVFFCKKIARVNAVDN